MNDLFIFLQKNNLSSSDNGQLSVTIGWKASRRGKRGDTSVTLCNVCVEKNEKDKKQADMYCYICDTVYCDNHAGVRYPIMSSPLANIIIIFLCVSVIQFTTLQ